MIGKGWKAVATVALVSVAGCSSGTSEKAVLPATSEDAGTAAVGVRAIAPSTQLEAAVTKVTGTIRSKQEATLSAPASGAIQKVLVKVGDRVKKDQVLAVLDTSNILIGVEQARAARAIARAAFEGATTELERARKLNESGSLPRAALEKVEIGHRQAQAQDAQAAAALRNAEEIYRDASLKAPFDGVITARMKNVGDTVSMMPPTPVFQIVDTAGLEVRAQVPEAIIDRIRIGTEAKGLVNPSGAPFNAKVTTLGAVIDPQTRTVEVLADVTPEGETRLRPGALVELDFAGAPPSGDVAGVFLPAQAVNNAGFVWLVQDGKVSKRDVKVERVLPGYVRVVDGLSPQDRVVADANLAMTDGTVVNVVQ